MYMCIVIIMGFSNHPMTPKLVVLPFWHIWILTIKISIVIIHNFIVKIKTNHRDSSRKFNLHFRFALYETPTNKAVYQSLLVHVTYKFSMKNLNRQHHIYLYNLIFEIDNYLQKKWHYALKTAFWYFSSML